MLNIQKAIKKIIERYIVNMTPLTVAATSGDTSISLASARRYSIGEAIVIYNKPSAQVQAEGEYHVISGLPGENIIDIDSALISNYPLQNSYVEKLIGFESGDATFLEAVYLGDPAVIPKYPAITIDAKTRSSEWFTLESTTEEYNIDITVYVLAEDYETQYEMMHSYVKAIECSLFRSLYPLVEPYTSTTLAEDVDADDIIIKLTDERMLECGGGWIWLESYDYLRHNTVVRVLGNGVYELASPIGREFSAGDSVIRPGRHIYNSLPHSTQYGTVNKDAMLKAAVISYRAQEEVRRFFPYADPLTF